jgi:hypothetical protein
MWDCTKVAVRKDSEGAVGQTARPRWENFRGSLFTELIGEHLRKMLVFVRWWSAGEDGTTRSSEGQRVRVFHSIIPAPAMVTKSKKQRRRYVGSQAFGCGFHGRCVLRGAYVGGARGGYTRWVKL